MNGFPNILIFDWRVTDMKKIIKSGKNNGVADQVQGQEVDVIPHPKHKGMWQFVFGNETWIASDYAFEDETI